MTDRFRALQAIMDGWEASPEMIAAEKLCHYAQNVAMRQRLARLPAIAYLTVFDQDAPGGWRTVVVGAKVTVNRENEAMRAALEHIADPIGFMVAEVAAKEGYTLDAAMAIRISEDPNHLKKIARDCLAAVDEGRK